MDLQIKTGVEQYKLRDENKRVIAEFELNPGDITVIHRIQELTKEFKGYTIPDTENTVNDVLEAEKYIESRFDYLLGYEASKEIFKRYSPLVTLPHGFFFQEILLTIAKIVNEGVTKRSETIGKQVEKAMVDFEK